MILSHELLPLIMKVMKYSMQPAMFNEPLEDFLEIFRNLDFLGSFNNLTQFEGVIEGSFKRNLMEINNSPRVYVCQYAREPKKIWVDGKLSCDLFHNSLTNGGFGYSFNQANFWDLYSPTWYAKEFANIYRPKGHNSSNTDTNHKDGKNGWRNSTDNIFYPVQTGPENGLTVTRDLSIIGLFLFMIPRIFNTKNDTIQYQ